MFLSLVITYYLGNFNNKYRLNMVYIIPLTPLSLISVVGILARTDNREEGHGTCVPVLDRSRTTFSVTALRFLAVGA
ncbi:hypothetical protein CTI12_AA570200 [Artemisia annua]|uniref:Uncharacterized protein n=1 Tax=Artemisia annua TaxID=35608 RepID=A0A2U1KRT1_ARTAN|nr:hypothetical protein CTI12_AA570200 [Artemisia annua]